MALHAPKRARFCAQQRSVRYSAIPRLDGAFGGGERPKPAAASPASHRSSLSTDPVLRCRASQPPCAYRQHSGCSLRRLVRVPISRTFAVIACWLAAPARRGRPSLGRVSVLALSDAPVLRCRSSQRRLSPVLLLTAPCPEAPASTRVDLARATHYAQAHRGLGL